MAAATFFQRSVQRPVRCFDVTVASGYHSAIHLGSARLDRTGWLLRRRHPALSLVILFYFTGQLIESSSIPLELYFEHRTYIPALLMFWPLGLWLTDTRALKIPKRLLLLALPLSLALMTHARAEVWGNLQTQALIWARINPDSARAQANAAQIEMARGRPQDAIRRLRRHYWPRSLSNRSWCSI